MTTDDIESDPLRARLRAADPAATLPADPDTVARLVEQTATAPAARRRGPLTWIVAAAAAVVIVAAATTLIAVRGGEPEPAASPQGEQSAEPRTPAAGVTTLAAGDPTAAGRCLPPSGQALAGQDVAFAGTVEQVADGVVTLRADEVYAGEISDRVEIEAPDASLEMLIGAVGFEVGGRYLVAASEGSISYCGLTGPATPALQRLYDQAFGQ